MPTLRWLLVNFAILLSTTPGERADGSGPLFVGLGDLPGGSLESRAYGVSADGLVVVGSSSSGSGTEAFRWTLDTGMLGLGGPSTAFDVSADGAVVVGQWFSQAFRWSQDTGSVSLGDFPDGVTYSAAHAVSADGSVVSGFGSTTYPGRNGPIPRYPAFRWTEATGLAEVPGIGGLPQFDLSLLLDVSADGSIIVGGGSGVARSWTQAGGWVNLGDLPGGIVNSTAYGVSVDGSVIVGEGASAPGREAFRWTQEGGMVGLGVLPGFDFSLAQDVSADGSIVVGTLGHEVNMYAGAFIWDSTNGMRHLRDVLVNDFGLAKPLENWNLESASAISADGRVVVGYGTNPNGHREAWIARLSFETTLPGDYNGDGHVEQGDLDLVLLNWGTQPGDPPAIGWINAPPTGAVDQGELDGVLLHWGQTAPIALATGAVPEPSSATLCLVFFVAAALLYVRIGTKCPRSINAWPKTVSDCMDLPFYFGLKAFGLVAPEIRHRVGPRTRVGSLVCVVAASLYAPISSEGQSPRFSFKRVVGGNTVVPGGGSFLDVFPPSLQSGRVAFRGLRQGVVGVYQAGPDGTVAVLADSTTLVPKTTIPFWAFGSAQSIDGNRVVANALAIGDSSPGVIEGYFAFENGMVVSIADLNTPIPSGTGNFTSLWDPNESPSADGGRVAFLGGGDNDRWGLYITQGDTLARVVDTSTPVPNDTRRFRYFRSPVLDGDLLAFVADLDDFTQGIYLHNLATGTLSIVAGSDTLVPGSSHHFSAFGMGNAALDLEGDTIVFVGDTEPRQFGALGVYRFDIAAATLTSIAQAGMSVPGQPGAEFGPYFQTVSVDDGHVAFQYGTFVEGRFGGFLTPFYGIYSDLGNSVEKVLGPGDLLDGFMVDTPGRHSASLEIGSEALDGKQLAMLVQLEDGTRAIYIATLVPEPTTMLLSLFAALVLVAVRLRRPRGDGTSFLRGGYQRE